jgi:LysM repeat protein
VIFSRLLPANRLEASRVCGLAVLALASLLSSCTTQSPKIEGIPGNLPVIALHGQARTPPHNMRHGDYPFDANGNYVTSWAAEGGSAVGPSDYKHTASHHDDPPPRRSVSTAQKAITRSIPKKVEDSPPKKVASSTPAKKSTSASSSSTSKKSDSPPAKKSTGGGGSVKHTVKGSDSLYGLAKKYGTTVAKIKAANGLSSDMLRDGRTLTIPQ